MKNRIINTLNILWLQLLRQPLFLVLLLGGMIYEGLGLHQIVNPGEFMPRSSFLVQGGILAFLFIGIWIVRIETIHQLDDLYLSIHNGFVPRLFAKLIFGAFISFFVGIILYIEYAIVYLAEGFSFNHLFFSAFLYVMLYFSFTFYISYLLGFMHAFLTKDRVVYLYSIIIWGLIGPANFVFLGRTLQRVAEILNLGEPNPTIGYDGLYGFAIDSVYWQKHLLWLVILLGMFLLALSLRYRVFTRRKTNMLFISLSVIVFVLSISLNLERHVYSSGNARTQPREMVEQNYYSKKQVVPKQYTIRATSYTIDLRVKRLVTAQVKMALKNQEQQSLHHVDLSLYHGFKVRTVRVNGQSASFSQKKDRLHLTLKNKWISGRNLKVEINYQGLSSPLFYANGQSVYLPYYFNWLPSTQLSPSFTLDNGSLTRMNHQNMQKVSYVLHYRGRTPLYTNIPERTHNSWSGNTRGLTLVSGEVQNESRNGKSYVHTTNLKNPQSNDLQKQTMTFIEAAKQDLDLGHRAFPKTIFRIPILSISDLSSEEFAWYTDDTLIVSDASEYLLKEGLDSYVSWLVPAVTWKYDGIRVQDPDYVRAFDMTYAYLYNQSEHIGNDSEVLDWYQSVKSTGEKQEVLEWLSHWMKGQVAKNIDISVAKKKDFCRSWYRLMKSGDSSWSSLNQLLKKEMGRS
ncbi:MAG: hypothetical protein ABF629_03140 [Sporolactobacillus sp.]